MNETKKNNKMTIIAICIAVVAIVAIASILYYEKVVKPNSDNTKITLNSDIPDGSTAINKDKDNQKTELCYFTGFVDTDITGDDKFKCFCNKKNDEAGLLISFIIQSNGKTVYDSGLVEPGKAALFDARKVLGKGTHKVKIYQTPYQKIDRKKKPTKNNIKKLYSVDQPVTINVK